jgi:4-diphosphocytidyl-2-C-methyl-D-erythritol kinase
MHVRRTATHVEILAPAKINLFLEVLAKRPDGYHEIVTLISAATLYDSLTFIPRREAAISLAVRWASGYSLQGSDNSATSIPAHKSNLAHELLCATVPDGSENLAWRAADLVRQRAGIHGGAAMKLVKRIPAAAGLGGASSDAAAALVAATAAWNLNWPHERLLELASELGSDVPFFLTPGAAVCRGRGDQIECCRSTRLHLVIVRPPVGLSTPRVYQNCRPADRPVGIEAIVESMTRGNAAAMGRGLVNSLQPAAARLTPWIDTLRQEMQQQGVLGHQMSGSGSSYFGLCRSARHARRVAARLRSRKIGIVFQAQTAVAT